MPETIRDLDDPRFTEMFTSFTDSAWRLEGLDFYDVGYEREAFDAFLEGDTSLIAESMRPWIEGVVKPAVADDRYIGRVHIIERTVDTLGRLALNDYLRFELECYKHTKAAGEDIRIAWVEPGKWPKKIDKIAKNDDDFWLFDVHTDHARVMKMFYTADGKFEKAVISNNASVVRQAHQVARIAERYSKPFNP